MKIPTDPRPDLSVDHELWQSALCAAVGRDQNAPVYWALDGLRCLGVSLRAKPDGALRLEPGEMDATEFQAACARYLLPHLTALRAVLRDAASRQAPEECVSQEMDAVRCAA